MILKSDAKFEEKLICCFKSDKNLVNFDASTQKSPKLHFDWFLLCKVYNVWPWNFNRTLWRDPKYKMYEPKTYDKVMIMKYDAKFREELTFVSKLIWGIWQSLARALESLRNLHFNELFLIKVYNVLS